MSAWDRRDALMKYEALFDEAADEAELIATLGTPTKLAIGLALNYVPSPAPAARPAENSEPDGNVGEFAAGGQAAAPAAAEPKEEQEEKDVAEEPAPAAEEAPVPTPENEGEAAFDEEAEEPVTDVPRRKVRAIGLIGAILFGLVIGLPIALVLIVLGIPFILLGVAIVATVVWCAMSMIGLLAMFSDVLMIVGGGLLLCALGLLLTWFGLWLSFELGYLWIGGVVLRLGRALTYKKEVAAE